jgi:tight adherence protein B
MSAGELPLRAIQAGAAATLLLFVLGLAVRSLTLSLLAAVVGIAVGYAFTQRRRWTLAARVDRQLPDAMTVVANALSAGSTLFQALEAAARETPAPLGVLLRDVVQRAQLATTVEDGLRDLRDRVGSRDVASFVSALAIQRTTGGDLARLLRQTVDFLREEQRLRADARALSAQARYSAQMIGVLPFALFALFYAMFPSFVEPLTTTTPGLIIVTYAIASSAVGFYLIWRIAMRIEHA